LLQVFNPAAQQSADLRQCFGCEKILGMIGQFPAVDQLQVQAQFIQFQVGGQ
jgi:hypothetical protein